MSSFWASDLAEARLQKNDWVERYKGWGRPEQLCFLLIIYLSNIIVTTCIMYVFDDLQFLCIILSQLAWQHITCWLDRQTPLFCIKSHHVLLFHYFRDSWSFFLLFLICTFSVISLNSLTIWGIIVVVVEQNQSQFLNRKIVLPSIFINPPAKDA